MTLLHRPSEAAALSVGASVVGRLLFLALPQMHVEKNPMMAKRSGDMPHLSEVLHPVPDRIG
jgi:hypothetical protein